MTKRLGVTPYPQPNDSINGYLLNLAYCHGISKLSEFLRHIGMVKHKVKRWGIWSDVEINNLIASLSSVCNRDVRSSINQLLDGEYQRWLFGEARLFKELRVDFPRVCPLCLSQKRQIHKHWCIGTVARCAIHQELLFDSCPKCNKQLEWKESLFVGCSSCQFKWRDHAPTAWTNTPFSKFEQSIYPNDSSPNIGGKVNGLCVAMMAMARPFDIHYQPHQRIPYTSHHSELILNALALLESRDARSVWEVACNSERTPGLVNESHPIDSFKAELRAYPVKLTNTALRSTIHFKEQPQYVKPARRKLISDVHSSDFWYHVNHDGLAKALKLNGRDLLKLTESNTIPRINSTSVIRDQLFDTRIIAECIEPYSSQPLSNDVITITVKSKALRRNLVSYGQLLNAILQRKITSYFPETQDLSSVVVTKAVFETWLHESFKEACKGPQSKTKVTRALGISIADLDKLIETHQLHWASWQRGRDAVDGESLKNYIMNLK